MSDSTSNSSSPSDSSNGPSREPNQDPNGQGPSTAPAFPVSDARALDARAGDGRGGFLDRLRHLLGGWRSSGSLRSDLAEALAGNPEITADLSATERAMLKSILELRERRIGDLMVPRADIVAVQKDISLGELLTVFAEAGHSRLVVYDDTLDDPVGMVHIRDLVTYLTQKAMTSRASVAFGRVKPETDGETKPGTATKTVPAFNLKAIDLSASLSAARLIRRLLFVPPSMPSIELLASMQASRIHLALVIDEYGGTDGIVSMEDLVEEIVGDIEDEHDDDEAPMIARQADGSYIADARASLDEVADMVDPAFATGEEAEEVDTLGGLLVTLAGRVPVRGEIVAGPGAFEIEVLDADPRRVKRLRISPARGTGAILSASEPAAIAGTPERVSLPPPAQQSLEARPPVVRDHDAA